jgi:hypothetical protein
MDTDANQIVRKLVFPSETDRTMVGRIRVLLPQIELAQLQGVRLKAIVTVLNGAGFPDLNIKCLQNLLYQARRNKRGLSDHKEAPPAAMIKLSGRTVAAQIPAPQGSSGIDIERIMAAASKAAKPGRTSGIALELLRSNQN